MFPHGNFIGEGLPPADEGVIPAYERDGPPTVPALRPLSSHSHTPYVPPAIEPDPKDTRRVFYQYLSSSTGSWWHRDSRDEEAEADWLRREKGRMKVVLRHEGLPLPAISFGAEPPPGLEVVFSGVLPVLQVPDWPGDAPDGV